MQLRHYARYRAERAIKCQARAGAELATLMSHEREHRSTVVDTHRIDRCGICTMVEYRLGTHSATAVQALVRAGLDESMFSETAAEAPSGHSPAHARALLEVERDPHSAFSRRLVRGLLTTFPSSVRDELSRGVTWAALALYESAAPTVRLDPSASPDTGAQSPLATTNVDYHLVIAAGADTPLDWDALDATVADAPATAWPPHRRRSRHAANAPEHEQHRAWFVVAPGYALVQCVGRLSVGVVVDRARMA